MDYPKDYYGGLPVPPPYGYYYPPSYDPYLPSYWRYPPPPFHEMPPPYIGFGPRLIEEAEQKDFHDQSLLQNVKHQPEEFEISKYSKQLEEGFAKDKTQLVKIETENSALIRSSVLPKQKLDKAVKIQELALHQNISNTGQYENLYNLLKNFRGDLLEYNDLLKKLSAENQQSAALYSLLDRKLRSFKKSKQQMIKIIIRKTQRHFKAMNRCRKDQRFVKYGGFKSMNAVYLQTMFSDKMFMSSFEAIAVSFKQDFQKENNKKIQLLSSCVAKVNSEADIEKIQKIMTQKNKMPWPSFWLTKIDKIVYELYNIYGNKNSELLPILFEAMNK